MCEEKTDYEWRQNIIYNNGDRFLYAMVFMRFSVFGILEDDLLCLDSNEQEIELTDNDIKCDDYDIVVFSSMC